MASERGEGGGEGRQTLIDFVGLVSDAVAVVDAGAVPAGRGTAATAGPGARIRSANRRFAALAGVDLADLPGRPVGEALPLPGLAALVDAACAGNEAPEATVVPFGDRLLRITATCLEHAPAGGEPCVAVVVADVTDLHGAAAAASAAAAERRLDHVLDSLSATVWEIEVRTGAVRDVTPPSARYRGASTGLVGRPDTSIFSLVNLADLPRLTAAIRGLAPGRTTVVEHRLNGADGSEVPVRSHLRRSPDAEGTIIGVTVDVQELQAERHRRHAAIGSLAGGVAHELNNALSALYGHLAVLSRTVHDPRGQRSIAAAEGAAARAADITTRLLTFAGRQTLDISAVDVNDLVQEVAPDGPWRGGEVRIEHDLDPGLAPCRIDRDRAASAISELLVNALEAVPEGGVVRLATANVVDAGGHGLVEISVSDNGPGMEPDVLAQAIEPFFTTKSFGGSAGLGLGTVYGFVMQSDGSFLLESEPGRGTVARLRFPADRSDAAAETITLQTTGTTGRVLLVDEDDMVRESTAQILAMLGLSVVAASSAEAAADAAAADRFDVLVVDVSLGARLDGVGLIERLREHSPEPGVVVISGFAPDQLDLSRLAGPYEFLPKPFTVSEVTGALRRAGRPVG